MRRVQIRKVARLGTGHTPSRSVEAYWDPAECTIPWLTLADVWQLRDGSVSVVHETKEKISALGLANSAAVRHPAGTVAFSRTASVGFSCILGVDMATSQDFVTWTCGPNLDPRYLLWVLRAERDDILRRTQGSTHKTIYMPDIEQLTVPLPSLEEQRTIVEYLEHETARIDKLVVLRQRMASKIAERRRSALAEAMDRPGPRARLRHVTSRITSGPRGWSQYAADEGTLFIRIANLQRDDLEINLAERLLVNAPISAEARRTRVRSGDVLVSITADIGSIGIARAEHEGANVSQHVALLSPSRCEAEWLASALAAPAAQRQLDEARYGGTKSQLSLDDVAEVEIYMPDLKTQRQILQELEASMSALKRAASLSARQVALLREHRQALVTATVTGVSEAA